MSDTRKAGKRSWRFVKYKPDALGERDLIRRTYAWAGTEKIRRRNRPLWRRQLNKLRRKTDRNAIAAAFESQ